MLAANVRHATANFTPSSQFRRSWSPVMLPQPTSNLDSWMDRLEIGGYYIDDEPGADVLNLVLDTT
jgi:hypothetical protein